jgi:hypothetical protein
VTGLSLLFPSYLSLSTVRKRRAASEGTQGKLLTRARACSWQHPCNRSFFMLSARLAG